nr:hypothetical protein Iba_chr15fCG4900 [Ipomoea batatas]
MLKSPTACSSTGAPPIIPPCAPMIFSSSSTKPPVLVFNPRGNSCLGALRCRLSWFQGTLLEQSPHTIYRLPATSMTRSTSSSSAMSPGSLTLFIPIFSLRAPPAGKCSSTRGLIPPPIITTTPFIGTPTPSCGTLTACQSGYTGTTPA